MAFSIIFSNEWDPLFSVLSNHQLSFFFFFFFYFFLSFFTSASLFLLFFLSSLFQCLSFTPNGSFSYHTKPICTAQQIPSFFFSSSQPHLQSKPLSLAMSSDTFNLIQPTDLRPEKDDDATKRANHLQRSNCINRVTCTTY